MGPSSRRLRAIAKHVQSSRHAVGGGASPESAALASEGPVITAENWRQWEEEGFMVIKGAVPAENCDAVQREMADLLGWDLEDPSTWDSFPGGAMRSGVGSDTEPSNGAAISSMLNMWQTQGQWNNRQHPRIYKAFAELWGTHQLWCSIDCADCKPPAGPEQPGRGRALTMHCDVEERMLRGGLAMEPPSAAAINAPWGLRVQGNLYLDDTPEDGGGFRCVPGFHKRFDRWIQKFKDGERLDFKRLDDQLEGEQFGDPEFPVKNVGGQKGDFLIWHSFLPHSNGTNWGTRPRMCQYITMWPAEMTYWPTYRTTGDTRTVGPMVTDAPLEHMQVTADDGTTVAGAAPIIEEERMRRVKMWRERLPGGCYVWPPIELPDCRAEPRFRPAQPAQLTALGRKLLGIDLWEE